MHREMRMGEAVTYREMMRQPFQHPVRIKLPDRNDMSLTDRNDLFWLMKDIESGRFSRTMCLETLQLRKRPLLTKLPMPFFASTLRVRTITRPLQFM